jgi:anti-sigma regulatory factor (Ser/Thr protein kinase)
MRTQWSHQADWSALPENVSAARHFVCEQLAAHGFHDLVGDAQLVVSELATNAVVHARTPFTVMLSGDAGVDAVRVSVTDGKSFALGAPLAALSFDTRGRGLYLVSAYSKDWGVTPTRAGKTVWASFSLV